MEASEVAVVGSGVVAGAVAWELARAGRRPMIVPGPPSPPEIGHVASGPAIAYAEAVARLGRGAAREIWEVYRESHERLRSFLAGLPDDSGYRQDGAFLLALDRGGAALLADTEDMLREDGFAGEFLDHYMLETRLPLFGFAGAYWATDDAEVDASRLERALQGAALERGATIADLGTLRVVAASTGGVEIGGNQGRVRAERAVVAQPAVLPLVNCASMTRDGVEIAARLQPGLVVPSLARSGDGRFRWQSSEKKLRLEADRALDLEELLAGLPVRAPSAQAATTMLAVEDRRPVVGPLIEGSPLALAGAAEPCGVALSAARWIADWVRTGHNSSPLVFRSSRMTAGPPAN